MRFLWTAFRVGSTYSMCRTQTKTWEGSISMEGVSSECFLRPQNTFAKAMGWTMISKAVVMHPVQSAKHEQNEVTGKLFPKVVSYTECAY